MQSIAIVGMACRYPDARSPQELWENVLAQRRAFRKIPSERLNLDDYYHAERATPDRTYSSQGAFLTDYTFERERFRISGKTYRSSDLTHWLALDVAEKALADAGFFDRYTLPRETTGVLVGNTLTGEFSRAQVMRLRWPYVSRVLKQSLLQENWSSEAIQTFLERLEHEYKRPFAPVNEETLAGGLSNTISGRICNYFDLKGGGYTVDGACSSSLLAFIHACRALEAFDVDVALAGGVDLSIDPFEIIGFAKTSALAVEEMRVYDAHSHGFLPGEGCGFVVLMRYEDALERQMPIYAVVRGWGISSDGSGGITRPEAEGQRLALQRAYQRSGVGIESVAYFEGHGTGTEVGDATEIQALLLTLEQAAPQESGQKIPLSSVKANIGHTKAAAGIAGIIKATMALTQQIIPPTTGMVEPHPALKDERARVEVTRQGKLWPLNQELRVGVSSMGFGGINAHIVLEGASVQRRETLTVAERQLLASFQDAELFLFSAPNLEELQVQLERVLELAPRLSCAEMTDLAAFLAQKLQPATVRAALLAARPAEFAQRLQELRDLAAAGIADHLDPQAKIFLGSGDKPPRVAFLFPGQGSPVYPDGGLLRANFSEIDDLYRAMSVAGEVDDKRTEVAQPLITLASLAGIKILEKFGVQAQAALGHSLGELSALHWAGAMDEETLLRVARARGAAIAGVTASSGSMLSMRADAQTVQSMIEGTSVVISGLNSPRQTVVSGDLLAINRLVASCARAKIPCVRLPVSYAFHSPLVASAVPALARALDQEQLSRPARCLVSTVTGDFVEEEHIHALLCDQVTKPVRFQEAVERLQQDIDLFIEVGPGRALTRILPDITSRPAVATDAGSASLTGILAATAAAFVLGASVRPMELFAHRFTRPIDLSWQPVFLASPCEVSSLTNESEEETVEPLAQTTLEVLRQVIARHTELPLSLLEPQNRMLSDLHLNSITVVQILTETTQLLGITPSASLLRYADARLDEIVQTLDGLQQQIPGATGQEKRDPDGLAPWVRCFTFDEQEETPLKAHLRQEVGDWQIIAPEGYAQTSSIRRVFSKVQGTGTLLCLPAGAEESARPLLLQSVQSLLARPQATHFVLLQQGAIGAAFARTLSLEYPNQTVCIVHFPPELPDLADRLALEVQEAKPGFSEVSIDERGKRTRPVLAPYSRSTQGETLRLASSDVLLVSAGGKGIAAVCAQALAEKNGVALALLGRSRPEDDAGLREHLERLERLGIRYRYFSMDVLDSAGVARVIEEVERSLGQVTVLLHGAGVNEPQPLSLLNEEAMERVIAPKVRGLQNLLAPLPAGQLKGLITFGSVIGRSGLPGEAHYALANEWMAQLTTAYQQTSPECACLCIEWSVWSDVGMGERLGSVEHLRSAGILPIPPEEGIALFLELLAHRQEAARIVVSGRLGALPTVALASSQLPFLRFLEKPLVFYPGVELITSIDLSGSTDLYLEDHQLQGERLFPAVLGLEAMAQIAMAVSGNESKPSFRDVKFLLPLVVPTQGSRNLRLLALVRPDGSVEVAIRSAETGYQANHFEAICHFDLERVAESTLAWPQEEQSISLEPLTDLYGHILFHRGRFQRIKRYTFLHARECVAEIGATPAGNWFARYLPARLMLGDPGQRDALIHAIQACIPQSTLIPTGIEALMFAEQALLPGQDMWIYARERCRQGNNFTYDVEARASDGRVLEQWIGLQLQMVGATLSPSQWAEALLGPYCERRLADLWSAAPLRCVISIQSNGYPELVVRSGQPVIASSMVVEPHVRAVWEELLPERWYTLAEQLASTQNEPFDCAATRVLALRERLAEIADVNGSVPCLRHLESDGWQIWEIGTTLFFSFLTMLRSQTQPIVFTFSCQGQTISWPLAGIVLQAQKG